MTRGRKPKPTELKRLAGNPGKRPLNDAEPEFTLIKKVDAPEWLGELATTMWETVIPELLDAKILTVPDLHNVESFCMAYQRWRQAEEEIDRVGITIETEKSTIKNPAVTVANEAKKQMVQFGSLLGLDPSSRSRLMGAAKDNKPDNPFADL
ncbi:phage terminase small subunit P27 family [Psychrobacter pygoscelis]|uniref:phage terminase small subunit P27 family n=1 Tax=Psychrobacter pygoscelis TaxID=2488563 RepID=UPI001040DD27|nr:phage terminase small subunit P27 family [Psychrobacter pygoscelis]